MNNMIVISHCFDEEANIYRLVVGEPVHEISNQPTEDPDTEPEMILVGYTNTIDYVFDADDERWFEGGDRRPDDEVAADQRNEVKASLEAMQDVQQEVTPTSTPLELPGVGEAL